MEASPLFLGGVCEAAHECRIQHCKFYYVTPAGDARHEMSNWWAWPVAMIPVAIIGLVLSTRVWNARPPKAAASSH